MKKLYRNLIMAVAVGSMAACSAPYTPVETFAEAADPVAISAEAEAAWDAESGKLTLSGDYNDVWSVTGYSDYYVVLDQISREGWNYRTILKRKAE